MFSPFFVSYTQHFLSALGVGATIMRTWVSNSQSKFLASFVWMSQADDSAPPPLNATVLCHCLLLLHDLPGLDRPDLESNVVNSYLYT